MLNLFSSEKNEMTNDLLLLIHRTEKSKLWGNAESELIADGKRFKIPHEIIQGQETAGEKNAPKQKFETILQRLQGATGPVLFLAAHYRIVKDPRGLFPTGLDFAGYRGEYRPLSEDALNARAFWNTDFLYLNPTKATLAFLEAVVAGVKKSRKLIAEDTVFQNTWQSAGGELRTFVLPPGTLEKEPMKTTAKPDVCFSFGTLGLLKLKKAGLQIPTLLARQREDVLLKLSSMADKGKSPDEAYALALAASLNPEATEEAHNALAKKIRGYDDRAQILRRFEEATFRPTGPQPDILALYCEYLIDRKEHDVFEDVHSRVWASDVKPAIAVVDSFRIRHILDTTAKAGGWKEEQRPKVWWMRGPYPGNFGDILTPYLLLKLFGIPIRWTPFTKADCLVIGSIAKFGRPGLKMWGPGIAHPSHAINPKALWLAVRGPETQKALHKVGAKVPSVIGDPALLLPQIYQPVVKKTGYGLIIPHYNHYRWFKNVLQIYSKLEPEQIRIATPIVSGFEGICHLVDQIASADWVVASSLHGLIVAHAYGVKCCWVMPEEHAPKNPGDSIKYTDYMSSVGLPTNLVALKDEKMHLDDVIDQALPAAQMPDLEALKAVFPWAHLKPK